MKVKLFKILIASGVSLGLIDIASADGFSLHLQAGAASTKFQGNTQDITMVTDVVNQYSVDNSSHTNGLFGAGGAYQWDYSKFSMNLGFSAYYLKSSISGINSPYISGGDFDTLTYSATAHSSALMLEPKFIWNVYSWQPYVLTGVGIAWNRVKDYSEVQTVPGSSAVPTDTPFNNATKTNAAYEVGLGIQHAISTRQNPPMLALDYRFMDWGEAGLSTYTGQAFGNTLNFGHLQTRAVNLSLIWPF